MEAVKSTEFTLTFADIQGLGEVNKESLQLLLVYDGLQKGLGVGGCVEIPACEARLVLKQKDKVIGETVADLEDSVNAWIPIPPSFQVKIIGSVSAHPRKLQVQTGPPPVSKCGYIKKLQQIEGSEKEIQNKMTESYFAIPAQYQEVMGKNVSMSPGKGFFRKRTLDVATSSFTPDYTFSGHFEVSIANISASEEDILQNLAIGLLTRKHELEFRLKEIELHQEVLTDFDFFIKSLADSMVETKDQAEVEGLKMKETVQRIREEVKDIEKLTENTEKKIEEVSKEVLELREACERLKSEEKGGKGEVLATKDLRNALDKSQKEINSLEVEYEKVMAKYLQDYPEKDYASVVNQKILSLAELQRMVNLRDMEMQESIRLQREICELEAQLEMNLSLNEITEEAKKQESLFREVVDKNSEEYSKICQEREESVSKTNAEIEEIEKGLGPVEDNVKGLTGRVEEKTKEFKELQGRLEKIDEEKKNIALKTPAKISREEFLHNFEKTLEVDGKIRSNLAKELEFISNLLLKNASSSLKAQRVFRYVESQMENQGLQHQSMINMISSLKEKNPAYIPLKTDPVDLALGKYLNTHNNLEIKFTRIDKQVYSFGSIKVEVGVEDGNVFVVVDGNKNGIAEFISLYTALEKGKIRRSPSKINESPGKRAAKIGTSSVSK